MYTYVFSQFELFCNKRRSGDVPLSPENKINPWMYWQNPETVQAMVRGQIESTEIEMG